MPEGRWGLALFIALGLQEVYYSVPVGKNIYITGSEIYEIISVHYVFYGFPPYLSLEDLESRGAPYSLKITPVDKPYSDLMGAEDNLVLRYRIELVPNRAYASLFDLYEVKAVYNGINYTDDLLSIANATLSALQALEAGACEECERKLESCQQRLKEFKGLYEALENENSALSSEISNLEGTVNELRERRSP